MAVWLSVPFYLANGTSDGNWSTFKLAIGDPKQRIHALHSSRSTALEIPFESLCGQAQHDIFARSSKTHYEPALAYNLTTFDPSTSGTWVSSSGCEYGRDDISETLYNSYGAARHPDGSTYDTDESQIPRLTFRTPVRRLKTAHTPGLASFTPLIGVHAIPDKWAGARDYWWDTLLGSNKTLFQSIPIDGYVKASFDNPDLLYGYTAGAAYRQTAAQFSVGATFYQLMGSQVITSQFSPHDDRLLALDVLDLTLLNNDTAVRSSERKLMSGTRLPAILDTTDPFLELPSEICDQIARELGLQHDKTRNLFLMDEETVARLRHSQPVLQITLGTRTGSQVTGSHESKTLTLTLPFGAFDHFLRFPEKTQPYFPIRALDNSDIVLGRTLFQESYLVVDYGRQRFQLAEIRKGYVKWYDLWPQIWRETQGGAYFWRVEMWMYAGWVALFVSVTLALLSGFRMHQDEKFDKARERQQELRNLWLAKHKGVPSDLHHHRMKWVTILMVMAICSMISAIGLFSEHFTRDNEWKEKVRT